MILAFALLFSVLTVIFGLGALEVYDNDSPRWALVWASICSFLATYLWMELFFG